MQSIRGLFEVAAFTGLLTFLPLAGEASVALPSIFSDGAILQRNACVRVWGWASEGEKVSVSFKGKTFETSAHEGRWEVAFNPGEADAVGAELKVVGENVLTVKNVVVGDVWLCSGQSNMEMPVFHMPSQKVDIENAKHPGVRLFDGRLGRGATTPSEDLPGRHWETCRPTPYVVGMFSAVAFYFAVDLNEKLGIPIGVVSVCWGASPIEAWTSPDGFSSEPELAKISAFVRDELPKMKETPKAKLGNTQPPTALYNSMVAPLSRCSFTGAIWYQGEANLEDGAAYQAKMRALVSSWRKAFGNPSLPFLFVQIAPFKYPTDPLKLPKLWCAQRRFAEESTNVAMAVTNDIGDLKNIHPQNKKVVAQRLAGLAFKHVYKLPDAVACDFPVLESVKTNGAQMTASFNMEMRSSDGAAPKCFELAGVDKAFKPAVAKIEGRRLLLSSPEVSAPLFARYAWTQEAMTNLTGENGLPVSAFNTLSEK